MNFITDLRKKWAKGRFERNLAKVIEQANAHRSKGSPSGSDVYKVLWGKADTRVNTFCTTWNVPRTEIEAEVPQLAVIRSLTRPQAGAGLKGFVGIAIVVVLAMMAMGAASAVVAWSYHAVLNHLHF
jgi:hypothetical protein